MAPFHVHFGEPVSFQARRCRLRAEAEQDHIRDSVPFARCIVMTTGSPGRWPHGSPPHRHAEIIQRHDYTIPLIAIPDEDRDRLRGHAVRLEPVEPHPQRVRGETELHGEGVESLERGLRAGARRPVVVRGVARVLQIAVFSSLQQRDPVRQGLRAVVR